MTAKFDIEHFRQEAKAFYGFQTNETNVHFRSVQVFENNSNEPITVILRNNLPVIIQNNDKHFSKDAGLTIRTIYHFNHRNQIVATINHLDEISRNRKVKNDDLDIIQKGLLEIYQSSNGTTNFHSITIDRVVPLKKIYDHSGIYVHESDILICSPKCPVKFMQHPFSEEGMMLKRYHDVIEKNNVSGIFVELIDNDNKISNRYMYVAKRLIEIQPRVDKSRRSGVYYTKAGFDFTGTPEIEPEFHTYEEAEANLGLHKTEEEAITGGDPEYLNRAAENKIKAELLELKRVTEIEKTKSEEKLRVLQADLDTAKAKRNDYFDDQKLRRNDEYENRSYQRKDNSEIWKFASAICITALSVYAAVTKAQSK